MIEERVKRKISAILSADAAGYSRLMGEDEVSTVRTLEAYRKVMADLIGQFRGRVVDSPGDNLLAEFSSVVDAVQCAVEIHEVIRAKNEELPEDRRMLFRIGVNLGDVIEEGDRIYGDGVNIAARLEGLAEAGGICISGSAHEQIENKLALGYEYIGEHTVKNIAKPVKVYRVPMGPKVVTSKEGGEKRTKSKKWQWTALGAAGAIIVIIGALAIWYFSFRQAPVVVEVEQGPKTIAVLPFTDLSPEKDQEYFVDGLSEEFINCLSKVTDLRVTSRTSCFAFKESDKTLKEIASVLGVDHILEGSVRKVGNAIRITAQLIRVKDDYHLWSETYDRELKDIFGVQEDIATKVADQLKVTLGIGKSFKQLGGTDNMEAYELYMVAKGQHNDLFSKASFNDKEWNHVVELIDSVIALDPGYGLAWALKAKIHIFISVFGPSSLAAAEQNAGLKAALRAVELEPDLADAYTSLGIVRIARGELIAGELAYRKALELTTEPLSGEEYSIATFYLSVGDFKRANELFEEMRQNDPLNKDVRSVYLLSFGLLGDIQQAEKEYERGKALFGDQWTFGNLYITGLRLGEGNVVSRDAIVFSDPIFDVVKQYFDSPEDGLKKLRRYYTDEDNLSSVDLNEISWCVAYFGDPEFGMDVLKKTLSIDATGLFAVWGPVMKETRRLPRFKEFVREIGLVDYWNKFGWPDICRPLDDGDFECD